MDRQPTIVISSDWIMAAEAEARLKIANRTLREWAQAGLIRWKRNPDPVRKRERLYSASDVERLRAAGGPPRNRPSQARQLPAANIIAPSRHERQESRALDTVSIVGQLIAALKDDRDAERERERVIREEVRQARDAELRRQEERARPWLTLQQAIDVFGLPAAAIRRAVKEEKLEASKAGGLRIKRASLESFSA